MRNLGATLSVLEEFIQICILHLIFTLKCSNWLLWPFFKALTTISIKMTQVEEENIFRASMRQDILCKYLKLNKTFPNEIVKFIQGFIPHCLKVNRELLHKKEDFAVLVVANKYLRKQNLQIIKVKNEITYKNDIINIKNTKSCSIISRQKFKLHRTRKKHSL